MPKHKQYVTVASNCTSCNLWAGARQHRKRAKSGRLIPILVFCSLLCELGRCFTALGQFFIISGMVLRYVRCLELRLAEDVRGDRKPCAKLV